MHLVRVKPLGNVYWAKSYCQSTDHILQIEGLVSEVICVQLDYNFILKKENDKDNLSFQTLKFYLQNY